MSIGVRTESAMTASWEPVRDEPLSGWDGPHGDGSDTHGVPERVTWRRRKTHMAPHGLPLGDMQGPVRCEATHTAEAASDADVRSDARCGCVRVAPATHRSKMQRGALKNL